MEEIWKDIIGYEGYYQISNLGNVKSLAREIVRSDGVVFHRKERVMAKREKLDGYYEAKLTVNNHSVIIGIHILVARHFIPNPNNYPEVNHLDFNRKNNCVDNLEWCTHQQNVEYSCSLGRYKMKSKFGKDNPNYNNHTLKEKYRNDPKLSKEKNGRPGKQNGRCVPIRVHHNNGVGDFNFIGEAAEFLVNNNYTRARIDSVRNNISNAIKTNQKYLGCTFERI